MDTLDKSKFPHHKEHGIIPTAKFDVWLTKVVGRTIKDVKLTATSAILSFTDDSFLEITPIKEKETELALHFVMFHTVEMQTLKRIMDGSLV